MNKKTITAFGKSFETVKELCNYHNISERTFRHRTKTLGLTPETALVFGEYGQGIVIRGVAYPSRKECLEALHITEGMVKHVCKTYGCAFKEGIEKILTKREKEVEMNPISLFR